MDSQTPGRESVTANAHMSLESNAPSRHRPALPTLLSVSFETDPDEKQTRTTSPDDEPSRVTNAALDVRPSPAAFEFDDWLRELEQEADNGRNLVGEWKLRLVELAIGRDVTERDLGSTLSSETRKLLSALFETVRAVREVAANPLTTGDDALVKAGSLAAMLSDRADPEIATVALCRRVATFGVYEEMEADALIAGRELQTIVYSEIENLSAERTEDGRFETRVATRLELFDGSGASVWLKEEPEIVDACRRRRNDFFIAQRVAFPPTIPAGDYVLKVSIEDRNADRTAEYA